VAEIWFYHLERQTLDEVLPNLLERTLERGWRAVVQAGTAERLEAIDNLLWTYSVDSFLPHGSRREGNLEMQPVYLTEDESNPNGATVRFYVEGAAPLLSTGEADRYERLIYVFDGHDDQAVGRARETWKAAGGAGLTTTYWRQTERGGWEKQG